MPPLVHLHVLQPSTPEKEVRCIWNLNIFVKYRFIKYFSDGVALTYVRVAQLVIVALDIFTPFQSRAKLPDWFQHHHHYHHHWYHHHIVTNRHIQPNHCRYSLKCVSSPAASTSVPPASLESKRKKYFVQEEMPPFVHLHVLQPSTPAKEVRGIWNCETQQITDQKLSSPISTCRCLSRRASVTSPLMSTLWCVRPYKPYIMHVSWYLVVSGGVWAMSDDVWWCLELVWWC